MRYFIVFFLLFTHSMTSQISSGEVSYGERIFAIGIDTTKISNSNVKQVIISQYKDKVRALLLEKPFYKLVFTKNEAIFKKIPIMDSDINPNLNRILSKGVFYSNFMEDIKLRQLEAYNKNFLIEEKASDLKWDIKKENRIINGYSCYKATTFIQNGKKIKTPVIAWFTPEIPFGFGPKNYVGLPGLILELYEKGHLFYAMNVNLKMENIKIEEPKKGLKISKRKFELYGKEVFDRLKN